MIDSIHLSRNMKNEPIYRESDTSFTYNRRLNYYPCKYISSPCILKMMNYYPSDTSFIYNEDELLSIEIQAFI